ncbi:MAG: DNA mismatch repair endonuclease MutL, partial [Flammeovirgaceae bacterium]|nr:DNA mismatch repair endonuclease MutL [Flammeovirgaceae bacterium]MDW8286629.1 DNA mismatch repair endonuclease MutL [Flammeovirgaceae bacterium]
AHSEVAFSLYHNQQEMYVLKPGNIAKRIVALLGKNYQENLIPCQEEVSYVRIQGFIGKPACAKKTKGDQFFYVNHRYIKHAYLHHAVMSAFDGLIPAESYPFYWLNILIDPKHIDVNVHPTKTEVKFDDERAIYAVIRAAVLQALSLHGAAPSIDFMTNVNFLAEKNDLSKNSLQTSPRSFVGEEEKRTTPLRNSFVQNDVSRTTLLQSFEQNKTGTLSYATKESYQAERKQIMQLHQEYVLCQVRSGLMVVRLKAAYERIFFEKYARLMQSKTGTSQRILFTHALSLSATEKVILESYMAELQALGFYFELQKDKNYLLTAVPAEVAQQDVVTILQEILRDIKESDEVKRPNTQKLLRSISARTASLATKKMLTVEEAQSLIEQLFSCSNPHYSPDGKKIVVTLSLEEMSRLFE